MTEEELGEASEQEGGGGRQGPGASAARAVPDRSVHPAAPLGTWSRAQTQRQREQDASGGAADEPMQAQQCRKCKAAPAIAVVRQAEALCAPCLEASVLVKLRAATRAKGLISEGQRVMVAVSGGVSSMVLLYALLQVGHQHCCWCSRAACRCPRWCPPPARVCAACSSTDACPPPPPRRLQVWNPPGKLSKGRFPFELCAVHVDESAARGLTPAQARTHHQQLADAVAALGFPGELAVRPLHAVLQAEQRWDSDAQPPPDGLPVQQGDGAPACASAGDGSGAARLLQLLGSVTDVTGREDLAAALRHRLLLATAQQHGCSRLLLGDNASSMAVRIIADAAKGRAYSLPADIQLADARSSMAAQASPAHASEEASGSGAAGVAVLHPLREVTSQEVAVLAAARQLQLTEPPTPDAAAAKPLLGAGGKSSINGLASNFVEAMQRSLPSSVFTVLRTASHLQPFGFNDPAAIAPPGGRQRQPRDAGGSGASSSGRHGEGSGGGEAGGPSRGAGDEVLCAVCSSPVAPVDVQAWQRQAGSGGSSGSSTGGGTVGPSGVPCYSCRQQILGRLSSSAQVEGQAAPGQALEWLLTALQPR
jgi:tRNA(Ile)-lysidine synthase TilS/MesJ